MRRVAHFLVPSFYQQARPAPSCTSKPPSVLSELCFSIFSAFQPPRVFFQSSPASDDSSLPWSRLVCALGRPLLHLQSLFSFVWVPTYQDIDLSTYIGRIVSLEEFLTLMPFTNGVEAQQIQSDKFFMVLTLIGLRPDLESIRDQILASPSVPSLNDVFARLLRLSSTQTLSTDGPSDSSVLASQTNSRGGRSGNRGRGQRPQCTYCNKLGHTRDSCYQLHGRPPRTAHIAQSSDPLLSRPDFAASSTSQSITLTDSGASDHISGNKHIFSSITTTSALPTVTLANGSQTMAKGPEYGEDVWHRVRLGHPSISKFQKMVPHFSTLSSLACEPCQLEKHTRVSFPKHLNNRAKSPFELVHTDLWGPSRTASTLGFQYFVTFIDDYSRYALSRPLQVYHRQHHVVAPPLSSAEVPDDSPSIPPISPTPALSSTDHLPIALQKALVRHFLILGGDRRWLMKWLLCTPMAHGILFLYLLIYGCDIGDTFSSVAKITSVRLFLPMAAMCHWPLYQLDIKNDFLHGELLEEVYMEQPLGFVAQGESGLVCKLRHSLYGLKQSPRAWFGRFSSFVQEFGMLRSEADHLVFYHHNSSTQCIYLVVYVDDIVITGSDQEGIQRLKQHLFNHFQTKDLGKLKYFLGLVIA
ncbi:Retrovirus-related Pol polyprotein from transposon TNT 1-94 [Vitis vinifera]|uniref:Retrovirus-related Pol polyprotein from transposon TNT 1-94 n=1 Tax=Vitis vinifera TaxID=29760 RepID=A0A438IN61_VITVI|nr:Retrovirus-related Pol polyprotein from transposon TNT 1-94 [Vitis vinifera]